MGALLVSKGKITDCSSIGDDLDAKDVFTLLKLMLADPAAQSNDEEKKLVLATQRVNNMILEQHRVAGSVPPGIQTVLDVFREFLRYFWGVIRADIAAKIPLSDQILDYVLHKHTRIVVAAPAIWTGTMNNQFRRLLLDAGFTNAHIRSEPKLISAVIVRGQQQDLRANSTIDQVRRLRECACIVLDIGGGTTDLNSVQVIQIAPVLKFRTLLVGSGSMSGNELLNGIFCRSLSAYLYSHKCMEQIETRVGMSSIEVLSSFGRGFEYAKRDFHVGATGTIKIMFKSVKDTDAKLPRIPAIGLSGESIRMPVAVVKAVFDEYLDIIKGLLDQQLDALDDSKFSDIKKKAIMIVGGGALIPYINQTIISQYTKLNQQVVHQDDNNCSLVAKGGVLAAIDPLLGRREFSRTTYGISLSVPYDETNDQHVAEKHLRIRTPSYIDYNWEMPRQFEALIRYGDRLNVADKPAMINEVIYFRDVDISWPLELEQDIYQVDDTAWGLKEKLWR